MASQKLVLVTLYLSDNKPSELRKALLSLEISLNGELGVPSYAQDDVLSLQPSTWELKG